jgi:hypothetical protein
MPTQRDKAFADRLTDIAISIDDLCEMLDGMHDGRADAIIASLRDIEFECNELAEKVSPR